MNTQPVPKSQGSISTTKNEIFRIPEMNDASCSICLQAFDERAEVPLYLRCGHIFGHKCISTWIEENSGTCPTCRKDAYTNPDLHKKRYPNGTRPVAQSNGGATSATQPRTNPTARMLTTSTQRPPRFSFGSTITQSTPRMEYCISNYISDDKSSIFRTLVLVYISKKPAEQLVACLENTFVETWNSACNAVMTKLQNSGDEYKDLTDLTLYWQTTLTTSPDNTLKIEQERLKAMLMVGIISSSQVNCDFKQRLEVAKFVVDQSTNFRRLPPSGLHAPPYQWVFVATMIFYFLVNDLIRANFASAPQLKLSRPTLHYSKGVRETFVTNIRYILKRRVQGNDGWTCPLEF